MNNKEWIFSGIGVFILTLIVTFFTTKKLKNDSVSKNFVTNKLKAKHIQVNQTIISDSKTGDVKIGDSTTIDRKVQNQQLNKIKEEYFNEKNKIRTYLFKKLAKARCDHDYLEIRHITDDAELEMGLNPNEAFAELEKLVEEGVIRFDNEDKFLPTPYTRIKLTEKYFELID